tara:strand:+ start:2840 stop:5176 length:2337 start_codon:yes stop_codon:yes gene_type:complete
MSFASGLFSFGGGLSAQYREEVDAGVARKSAAGVALEETRQFNIEQLGEEADRQFEVSKFEDELDIKKKNLLVSESLRDIKKTEVTNAQYNANQTRILASRKIDNQVSQFASTHGLNVDMFELKGDQFDQAKKEFMDTHGLDEKTYNQNKDEFDQTLKFNYKELELDNAVALLEAEEGTVKYSGVSLGDTISISFQGATEKERLFNSLSNFNVLTNEQIALLTPEARLELKTDIHQALTQLKDNSYDETNRTWKDFTGDYKNLLSLDLVKQPLADVMNEIKSKASDNLKENGVDSDAIALETNNGMITGTNISYKQWAKQAGFETPEQLLSSVNSLITHNNEVSSYSGDLSPFRSKEALYLMMKNEGINFSMLQLAPELDYLQEAKADASIGTGYYKNLIIKAEELGIIGENGENIEALYNFIYKIQPEAEVIQVGGNITTALTPKEAGKDVDVKSAEAQYQAASTAIRTIDKMFLTLNSLESEDLFGLPIAASSLFEKVKGTSKGLTELINKVNNDDSMFSLQGKEKMLEGLNNINKKVQEGSITQELAEEGARLEYLKFSLAYQMSMALQGGSGGRTISDQDVDNMLRALNMDGIIKDADQVQASLQTIRSFMSGIASKTLYMSKGNMKGYRTSAHVIGLMDAINLSSLSKLANEMEQKIYMNSADMMTTSSDAQNIGIVNWDDNPYRTDVNSNSWTVFFKTQDGATYPYVSILGNTNEATQSYFLTQEMFDNYKNSEAGKGSDQVRALGSDYTVPTTFPNSMISITGQPIQTIGQ